ncbi:hypothetical protein B0H10DRAFT_1971016 [Mycena sp. CBHHK59/15]|nr:hypothetical protein B0H10DRAFT_1971016 [Mycena sp. CBHHK59/15]
MQQVWMLRPVWIRHSLLRGVLVANTNNGVTRWVGDWTEALKLGVCGYSAEPLDDADAPNLAQCRKEGCETKWAVEVDEQQFGHFWLRDGNEYVGVNPIRMGTLGFGDSRRPRESDVTDQGIFFTMQQHRQTGRSPGKLEIDEILWPACWRPRGLNLGMDTVNLHRVPGTRGQPAGFGSGKLPTRDPYPPDPTREPDGQKWGGGYGCRPPLRSYSPAAREMRDEQRTPGTQKDLEERNAGKRRELEAGDVEGMTPDASKRLETPSRASSTLLQEPCAGGRLVSSVHIRVEDGLCVTEQCAAPANPARQVLDNLQVSLVIEAIQMLVPHADSERARVSFGVREKTAETQNRLQDVKPPLEAVLHRFLEAVPVFGFRWLTRL